MSLVATQPPEDRLDSCGKCSRGHGGFTCAGRPPSSPHAAHSAARPARLLAACSLQRMQRENAPTRFLPVLDCREIFHLCVPAARQRCLFSSRRSAPTLIVAVHLNTIRGSQHVCVICSPAFSCSRRKIPSTVVVSGALVRTRWFFCTSWSLCVLAMLF